MSADNFRLALVICAVITTGVLLGGLIGIGVHLHHLVDAARAIRRCP